MYTIRFVYKGKPIGKERPRTINRNGKVWSYTPKKTMEYESQIRNSFLESADFFGAPFYTKEYEGKITVYINAYFKIPESYSDSRKFLLNGKPYPKKPDCDNLIKAILDSLNGVAYKDDSQVYDVHIKKIYNKIDGVEVVILYEDEK